jgi:hypothetical protein
MSGGPLTIAGRCGEAARRAVQRSLNRLLGKSLTPWDHARAAVLLGFIAFSAITLSAWLRICVTRPSKGVGLALGRTVVVTNEHDIALVRAALPATKVGYLAESVSFRYFQVSYYLAPVVVDLDWQKNDLVLADNLTRKNHTLLASAGYQPISTLRGATSFARGLQIYQRRPHP